MTTTVQEFIKDKSPVVTTTLGEPLAIAVRRMIEYGYSQLPVVNSENMPVGLITSDSILNALSNFGVSLDGIRVKHAILKNPRLFRQDIDLLDLLEGMDGPHVGLIVDSEGKLVQIITSFDTADYFRQRANDILLVENIENTLKDYIQLAFGSYPDGEARLGQSIQSMTNSRLALQQKFERGLRHYHGCLPDKEVIPFDSELVKSLFERFGNKCELMLIDSHKGAKLVKRQLAQPIDGRLSHSGQ